MDRTGTPLLPDELALILPASGRITLGLALYADVRRFGRDVIDVCTEAALLKKGFMGSVFGVDVFVSRGVAPQHVEVHGTGVYCRHSSRIYRGLCGRDECAAAEVLGC